MIFPTYKNETNKIAEGYFLVAGCDEVGIAPLAGPVVAATAILDSASIGKQRSKNKWWYRVRDSKTVNEKERGELVEFIKDHCIDYGVGIVNHETIDEINIFHAAQLAMRRSFESLKNHPDFLFVDGLHKIRNIEVKQSPVVDGDAKILSISAASIIAKVARDKILKDMDVQFPQYGFAKHKGYPTLEHKSTLMKWGVSPIHRQSFAFITQLIKTGCSMKNFQRIYLPTIAIKR